MSDTDPSTTDPQAEEQAVVALLVASGPGPAQLIETHAARVVVVGSLAYKVKKRVRLPFLDFTTPAERHRALARELELNRPHAPDLYHRLVSITREPSGRLALDGTGHIIDWALEMKAFEQQNLLAEIVRKGPLNPSLADALAKMIASYHRASSPAYAIDGAQRIEETLAPLLARLEASSSIDRSTLATLTKRVRALYHERTPLAEGRALAGAVRRCHGDLHLGNIVLIAGEPVPFDALEFDERLATIDVLYDLAFILMDLLHRGQAPAANRIFNGYMKQAPIGNEIEGLPLLPLFLAMRAMVRAVVAETRSEQPGADLEAERREVRTLVALAAHVITPPPPRLIAVGGFSGTGKSTTAAALAHLVGAAPGALHLRSDVERKKLFGVDEHEHLDKTHYTERVSDEVYRIMLLKAERALAAGHSVIVDAVFAKPTERRTVQAISERSKVPFSGLWLDAAADVMIDRVTARRGDASDADTTVVNSQLAMNTGKIEWMRLSSHGTPEDTSSRAAAKLGLQF